MFACWAVTARFLEVSPRSLRRFGIHVVIALLVVDWLVIDGSFRTVCGSEQERAPDVAGLVLAVTQRSKELEDPAARVRILAEAGEVMWELDRSVARDIFQEACHLVLTLDEGLNDAPARELASNLAARVKQRDPELFEWFVSKLQKKDDASNTKASREKTRDLAGPVSVRAQVLLEMARQNLQSGNFKEASNLLGESFLDGVLPQHGFYMRLLAERDQDLASLAFRRGLDLIRNLQRAELADVLGMAGLLFNLPGTDIGGRVTSSYSRPFLVEPDPVLVHDFMVFAFDVILAQASLARQQPAAQAGADSPMRRRPQIVYSTIEQMLPLFGTHLPEAVPALRQEQASMLGLLQILQIAPPKLPDFQSPSWNIAAKEAPGDEIADELEKARNAPLKQDRDNYYFSATIHAIWKDDLDRAEEAAKQISDSAQGNKARSLVKLAQLRRLWKSKDTAGVTRKVQAIEDPVQKAQAFVWLAQQLKAAGDESGAEESLQAAGRSAQSLEASFSRLKVFLAITQAALRIDETLAFESLHEAIKTMRGIKAPSPRNLREDGSSFGFPRVTKISHSGAIESAEPEGVPFDLFATLRHLGVSDFYRSFLLVNEIGPLEIKLLGQLALARSQSRDSNRPKSGSAAVRPSY